MGYQAEGESKASTAHEAPPAYDAATKDTYMDSDDEEEEDEEMEPEVDPIERAAELKQIGNEYYKKKEYLQALVHYRDAVALNQNSAALYGNISATCIMMERYQEALEAAEKGISVDPSFVKNHLRAGKASLSLGKFPEARMFYTEVVRLEPHNSTAVVEKGNIEKVEKLAASINETLAKGQYAAALHKCKSALALAPNATRLFVYMATAMLGLKKYGEATDVAMRVLKKEKQNPDALYIRSRCLFSTGNVDSAITHLKHALRSSPDHTVSAKYFKKLKKLEKLRNNGKEHFVGGRYFEAESAYSEAIELLSDETGEVKAKIYCNRALTKSKTGREPECVLDCTEAIKAHDGYTKAYTLRAQTFMKSERYDEAVRDYTHLAEENPQEYRQALQNAKLELKKSKRKDYYKLLDCPKDADAKKIKKCWKMAALKFHPDKVKPDQKEEAEKKIKDVNEAYAVLSDPQKKSRYDSGADLEEINQGGNFSGGGFGGMDMNDLFAHMARGNGGGFGFGGRGGGFGF